MGRRKRFKTVKSSKISTLQEGTIKKPLQINEAAQSDFMKPVYCLRTIL